MALIRSATEKDIPRILELYRQLSLEPEKYLMPHLNECRRVFREMSGVPGFSLLVAEEEGQVVGSTVLAVLPGFAHGTSSFAVVEYVVVDEQYRSRGIGRLMMEAVISLAMKAGCYKVMLMTGSGKPETLKFYLDAGFEQSKTGFQMRKLPIRPETS